MTIKIVDVRCTSRVPSNSVAAVTQAVRSGFHEVLVEPLFSLSENDGVDAFLGDYPVGVRHALYQYNASDYFAQNRLLETPEPLSSVLYIPGMTWLWCWFQGPSKHIAAVARCLNDLRQLMPDLQVGMILRTASEIKKFPGLSVASSSPDSDFVLLTGIAQPRLMFSSFRKKSISLLPWPLGAGKHVVNANF